MRKTSFILLLLTLLTACGQRDPLYLPDAANKPPTNSAQPAPVPQNAAQQSAQDKSEQGQEQ